ncbi:amidase [Zavarzinia compransoris]|uniref:amidase n=1 Tax=Zavarzinia marina TaxID=2911065 RepID=UPI001F33FC7A|nr:amidase [Zavarzinia marina]MCF4165117.1 amidase [Zavarzinia marina]
MISVEDYAAQDALGLARLVAEGEVTPGQLLERALERVNSLNPAINAVTQLNERDARRQIERGLPQGPFTGVPMLIKDMNAHVAGWPLTNGSRLYEGFVCDHDSVLIERYRQAGFVLFGRTTSPELGLTSTTENRLTGQTRNPYDPERTSGGSSGGAAAAVAAGIIPLAHASDGGGSIRIPAACCGLFGLKPSRARISMAPDAAEGWGGMSTVHAVARTVRDSAALLDATAAPVAGDPYAAPAPSRPFLSEVGAPVERLRIALCLEAANPTALGAPALDAIAETRALLADLGHEVVEVEALPLDGPALAAAQQAVIGANVARVVDQRLAVLGRDAAGDLIETVTAMLADGGRGLPAPLYLDGLAAVHGAGRAMARFLDDGGFDLLLTPILPDSPPPLGTLSLSPDDIADYIAAIRRYTAFTGLQNMTGQPAMSVPMGLDALGLPRAVQFTARFGDEARLFRLAAQLETAAPWAGLRPPAA